MGLSSEAGNMPETILFTWETADKILQKPLQIV